MLGKRIILSLECLEILGILASIQNDDLEDCVLKIFNECRAPVGPGNIETFHRLKPKARQKKVIIKLSKKKNMFNIYNASRN